MRRSIVGILTIAASIVVLVGIWTLLSFIRNPEPDAANIQKIFIVRVSDFRPEPSERLQYTLGVILFPIVCAIFFLLFNRLQSNFKGNIKYIHLTVSVLSVALVILLAVARLQNVNNNYLLPGSLFCIPILGFVFCLLAYIAQYDLNISSIKESNKTIFYRHLLYFGRLSNILDYYRNNFQPK